MQLQEVRRPAGRDELAVGDDDAHLVVVQRGPRGRHTEARHPVDGVGARVGGQLTVAGTDEEGERVGDHPFQLVGDPGVLPLGLPVHHAIDVPGNMSWNCCSNTVSQQRRSVSVG